MKLPLRIVFRNMRHYPETEELIRRRVAKLEQITDSIISCRAVVEMPHHNHRKGNAFVVRIDISVPQKEIVVNTETSQEAYSSDLYAVMKRAFGAASRQLEDYARERKRDLKTHEAQPAATVSRLFPEEEYGFLTTADGREIYFHAHSVLDEKFDKLKVGAAVTFVEEEGEKGPQASTVRKMKSQHSQGSAA